MIITSIHPTVTLNSVEKAVDLELIPHAYSYSTEIECLHRKVELLQGVVSRLCEALLGENRDRQTLDEHIKNVLGSGYEVEQGHGNKRFL